MISIIKKLVISFALGVLLLVGAILPAEYGIDFLGLGKITGLNALANEASDSTSVQDFGQKLTFNIEDYDTTAEKIDKSIKGLITLQDTPFKSESIVINIEDIGEVEHKFIMDEGMSFVYSWKALDVKGEGVYYDFHGHPQADDIANYPDKFEMAYSKSEGSTQSGSFVAPFAGLHGFYFMNLEEGPITIELTVSGFFKSHQEVYRAIDGEVTLRLDL